MDPQVFIDIELAELEGRTKAYKERGWGFANLCGSTVGSEVELLCTFTHGEEMENLRLLVSKEDEVPALSPLFPSAFFFENETKDLFGVQFKGISIDFGGKFYPTSVPTPMNPASLAALQYLEAAVPAKTDDAPLEGDASNTRGEASRG
jgi:ech hydrogenase subunit D